MARATIVNGDASEHLPRAFVPPGNVESSCYWSMEMGSRSIAVIAVTSTFVGACGNLPMRRGDREPLFAESDAILDLAADSGRAYWIDRSGEFKSIDLVGGEPQHIASLSINPVQSFVAAASGVLAWTDYDAASIPPEEECGLWCVPQVASIVARGPGGQSAIASGQVPWGLAVEHDNAYWIRSSGEHDELVRGGITDGSTLVIAENPVGLAVGDGVLYTATEGDVISVAADGTRTVVASGERQPRVVSADERFVYWVSYDDPQLPRVAEIRRASLSTGSVGTFWSGSEFPENIQSDGNYVYWQDGVRVLRLAVDPSGDPETVVEESELPVSGSTWRITRLAVDATSVYWVDWDISTFRLFGASKE